MILASEKPCGCFISTWTFLSLQYSTHDLGQTLPTGGLSEKRLVSRVSLQPMQRWLWSFRKIRDRQDYTWNGVSHQAIRASGRDEPITVSREIIRKVLPLQTRLRSVHDQLDPHQRIRFIHAQNHAQILGGRRRWDPTSARILPDISADTAR